MFHVLFLKSSYMLRCNFLNSIFIYFHFFARQRKQGSPITWFTSQIPSIVRARLSQSQKLGTHLQLAGSYHWLLRMRISRKLDLGMKLDSNPGTPI